MLGKRRSHLLSHLLSHPSSLLTVAVSLLTLSGASCSTPGTPEGRDRWRTARASAWYARQPWLVGCNFSPSTAINQLEMWQEESFDPATIDRELGWAEDLGFNTVRVYLHDLLWKQDAPGFLKRMDQFLEIADGHDIRTLFVLLDGVWDPFPKLGKQRTPRPHVHNSGWVQSPGVEVLSDPARQDHLEAYVKGVVGRFRDDPRVVAWDIFNEPDNPNASSYGEHEPENKPRLALDLLRRAYSWARAASPDQPITAAVWRGDWSDPEQLSDIDRFMLTESDIVSFHNYSGPDSVRKSIEDLRQYGRPIVCTEYMARPTGSTFQNILPVFKAEQVGAYNWGFVAGKTQTIYPWESWRKNYTSEPEVWFHDIYRPDGTPYREAEVELIRRLTGPD